QLLFIGCSDSRVPESAVFSSEPGDVFVHRNIANQFHTDDDNALSVLTYGLQTLKIQDVVVVGHTHCGGAEASYKAVRGLPVSPLMPLQRWLVPLTTLAGKVTDPIPLPNTPEYEEQLQLLIEENVKAQVENITAQNVAAQVAGVARALEALRPLERPVRVHGLVYDIVSRKLRNLHVSVTVDEAGSTA
ncbi:hypothetical protein HETIRDRAFT_317597, partial [Heterobasidion irregulare TC 32-1]